MYNLVAVKFTTEQITFLNKMLKNRIEQFELIMKTNPFCISDADWSKEYADLKEIREIVQKVINE